MRSYRSYLSLFHQSPEEEAPFVVPSTTAAELEGSVPVGKHNIATLAAFQPMPKKPTVPAVATVEEISAEDGIGGTSKR